MATFSSSPAAFEDWTTTDIRNLKARATARQERMIRFVNNQHFLEDFGIKVAPQRNSGWVRDNFMDHFATNSGAAGSPPRWSKCCD